MEFGGEYSKTTSASTSLLWKFLWQPQAAQFRASSVPSSPLAMNSRHPSTANPPSFAAWFFWHSAYRTSDPELADQWWFRRPLEPSDFFTTTSLFFMVWESPKALNPPIFAEFGGFVQIHKGKKGESFLSFFFLGNSGNENWYNPNPKWEFIYIWD